MNFVTHTEQARMLMNFLKLLDCDTVSDVAFEVGNLECGIEYILSNRTMFAAHSQVFKQMFFGPMIESKSRKSRNIILNDISPHTFKKVKEYCYDTPLSGILSLDPIDFAEIIYFSDKYLFTELMNQCIDKIKNHHRQYECSHQFFESLNKLHQYKLHHFGKNIISRGGYGEIGADIAPRCTRDKSSYDKSSCDKSTNSRYGID